MSLRDISAMAHINDAEHSRSLIDSIMMPEVITALTDWISACADPGVLIGDLALSYHVKPRYADCIEVFATDRAAIPESVAGFTRLLPATFVHNRTDVLVHVRSSAFMDVPAEVAQRVVETALFDSGIKVASESGLVALKLFRLSYQNQADIVALIKTGRVDMSAFPLPREKIEAYQRLLSEARDEAARLDDPDPERESLARGSEEWPEHRVVELDIDLSPEKFEWEGPFASMEDMRQHNLECWYEEDGIPDSLPEPNPAEVAVIAEMAEAAGIVVCPDRLLEMVMSDRRGPQLVHAVRAEFGLELEGWTRGDPVPVSVADLLRTMASHPPS